MSDVKARDSVAQEANWPPFCAVLIDVTEFCYEISVTDGHASLAKIFSFLHFLPVPPERFPVPRKFPAVCVSIIIIINYYAPQYTKACSEQRNWETIRKLHNVFSLHSKVCVSFCLVA